MRLSWEPDGEIRIEWHNDYPLVHKPPRSHKTKKDRFEVMLPEFWDVCNEDHEKRGLVFPIPTPAGNMTTKRIIGWIGKIGEKAGVVTNPDKRRKSKFDKDGKEIIRLKTATSHDIGRRAFLPKIDSTLTQSEAHKAMGHASFNTTATYYDTRNMSTIAAKLWNGRDPKQNRTAGGASGGADDSDRSDTGEIQQKAET